MKTPGSGRKKGAPNKRTLDAVGTANRLGCDPFEVLINFAKGDWKALGYEAEHFFQETKHGPVEERNITADMRLTAAKEAVKYLLPQRRAVELSADDQKGFALVIKDYTKAE